VKSRPHEASHAIPDAIEAMQSHPRFPHAVRAAIRDMVAWYDGNRLLNQLMNDRARALFTHAALALHFARDESDRTSGLTVSRIKAYCTEMQLCSPGRVEAMLALLRISGYLAAVKDDSDRRVRRLVPTEKLIALHRERCKSHLNAMREIVPDAALSIAVLDDPAFMAVLARENDRQYRRRRLIEGAPELASFVEPKAGLVLLFVLMLGDDAEGEFATERPIPISVSALAQKFTVSRKHVLTILRDAESQGLLRRTGERGEQIVVQPKLVRAVQNLVTEMFMLLSQSARAARRDIGLA
jgi:hypothetical protein